MAFKSRVTKSAGTLVRLLPRFAFVLAIVLRSPPSFHTFRLPDKHRDIQKTFARIHTIRSEPLLPVQLLPYHASRQANWTEFLSSLLLTPSNEHISNAAPLEGRIYAEVLKLPHVLEIVEIFAARGEVIVAADIVNGFVCLY